MYRTSIATSRHRAWAIARGGLGGSRSQHLTLFGAGWKTERLPRHCPSTIILRMVSNHRGSYAPTRRRQSIKAEVFSMRKASSVSVIMRQIPGEARSHTSAEFLTENTKPKHCPVLEIQCCPPWRALRTTAQRSAINILVTFL